MELLFIVLAALFNTTKSYCSKRISNRVETMADTVDMTVVRNGLCAVLGALIIAFSKSLDFTLPKEGFIICLVAGVAIGVNYIVWVLSLKSGVFMMASTVTSASFIVATVCGMLFFREKMTVLKGVASVLILLAIVFMGKYQKQNHGKIELKYAALLAAVFLTAGASSVTQKWFTCVLPQTSVHIYTFYSMLFSVAILLVMAIVMCRKRAVSARAGNIGKLLWAISIMAVCFYATTYFQTGASAKLEAVIMYPILNGVQLVAGCIMAWVCFSEKPNRNSIIGMLLVFAAIVLAGL